MKIIVTLVYIFIPRELMNWHDLFHVNQLEKRRAFIVFLLKDINLLIFPWSRTLNHDIENWLSCMKFFLGSSRQESKQNIHLIISYPLPPSLDISTSLAFLILVISRKPCCCKLDIIIFIKEGQRQVSGRSKSELPFCYVLVLFVLLVFNLSFF